MFPGVKRAWKGLKTRFRNVSNALAPAKQDKVFQIPPPIPHVPFWPEAVPAPETTQAIPQPTVHRRPAPKSQDRTKVSISIPNAHLNLDGSSSSPDFASTFTCNICLDLLSTALLPPEAVTSTCTHLLQTCLTCLRGWVESEALTVVPPKIRCPDCSAVLSHQEARRLLTPETFVVYDHRKLLLYLSRRNSFRWCVFPDCGFGQIHPGSGSVRCYWCCRTACFEHLVPWHELMTCSEYGEMRQKNEEHSATVAKVEAISRLCPNRVCGARIQKDGGCSLMTCTNCGQSWFWGETTLDVIYGNFA